MKRNLSLFPRPYGDIPKNSIAIVIDVIRATSTIATFFGEGGKEIFVVEKVNEAFLLRDSLSYRAYIAGERGGKKVEGFDFDNSPFHIKNANVMNKNLILTTTNGTKTIKKYSSVRYLFAGSFLNIGTLSSVATNISKSKGIDIYLICAGKEDSFILDDFLCGGAYIKSIIQKEDFALTDSARIALEYYDLKKDSLKKCLLESESGKNILRFGKENDIEFLSQFNIYTTAPYLADRDRLLIKDFLRGGDEWTQGEKKLNL